MFSRVRSRLTYANVVLTLALVFAMSGGAFAAKHYLITSTSQISPKVLKQLTGKAGSAGTAGPAGPAGPVGPGGPTGAPGANGKDGTDGTNGKDGAAGESVSAKEVVVSNKTKCAGLGGIEYTVGGKTTLVCNGQTGFTETLPVGKTETGAWAVTDNKSGGGGALVKTAISFTVPLAAAPAKGQVISEPVGYTGTTSECPGTAAEPKAKEGFLCVYAAELTGSLGSAPVVVAPASLVETFEEALEAEASAGTSGAKIVIVGTEEVVFGAGTWAVTA